MKYRISIIIPIYNVEPYIEECLQSVVSQTMSEGVECILVDDSGKDMSLEIAKNYVQNYNGDIDFKIIEHKANGGLSAARNTGIQTAKGEYLYFLDSDDTITPNCLELMWSYIDKYGKVDLVQGSFYENEEEKLRKCTYLKESFTDNKKIIKSFLLKYLGDVIPAQSRLVNKTLIINNNLYFKEGIIHEDNYWSFFLAKYVDTLCFCGERTYYHRHNPNSITRSINKTKEIIAYKTIIRDLCLNFDSFLMGNQKEYILNNYITCIENNFYESDKDKDELFKCICTSNNFIENFILKLSFSIKSTKLRTKLRHFLIRLYKF